MDNKFFFITTYDNISGSLLASLINTHPDIACNLSFNDPFLHNHTPIEKSICQTTIDKIIEFDSQTPNKLCGNIQRFPAFELQHKSLTEKSKHPYTHVNIAMAPNLRINFLLDSWINHFKTAESAYHYIEQALVTLQTNNHELFSLYRFNYFYAHILNTAKIKKIDLTSAKNKLFLIALAKVIAYDTADLPTPCKTFNFEKLMQHAEYFNQFINRLASSSIIFSEQYQNEIENKLTDATAIIETFSKSRWEPWRIDLLALYTQERLHTIYYPHIDNPLGTFYAALDYKQFSANNGNNACYSKLISIQLNSNRPRQLSAYFDNIEETANDPTQIEVLVNIDDNDANMETLLTKEMAERKFTLKYIKTPQPKSFCDLWKPINKLLEITDPQAYFLLNISDEMLFATPGWDSILKKYVGFFPDHLFRLRASRNKFKNYFDRWEASFAQDCIPFTTKKWIDIGGDWNPCFGPDSYQQLIAFYLAKEGAFSNTNYLRDIPIIDIQFHGDVPAMGIEAKKAWKHGSDHIKAMEICQSYRMQLEARKRAIRIKAHIIAAKNQLENFAIIDYPSKKQIHLLNKDTKKTIRIMSYRLSRIQITLVNQWRKLQFNSYFGDGKEGRVNIVHGFLRYLKAKYLFFYYARLALPYYNRPKKIIRETIGFLLRPFKKNNPLTKEYNRVKQLYEATCLENEILNNKIIELITAQSAAIKQKTTDTNETEII